MLNAVNNSAKIRLSLPLKTVYLQNKRQVGYKNLIYIQTFKIKTTKFHLLFYTMSCICQLHLQALRMLQRLINEKR